MTEMRVDLRREYHALYTATADPTLVDVPSLCFAMLDGQGDPETSEAFRDAVSGLYAVAYTARFALRHAGVLEYSVMPLEGLWDAPDPSAFTSGTRDSWQWTLMIMQPMEVADRFDEIKIKAATRAPAAADVRLHMYDEGQCAQVLHRGPYAAEGPTIAGLHKFIAEQGLTLRGKHHEIYLSDPRRCAPERLRTILRQPVS